MTDKKKYADTLQELSIDALKTIPVELRAQVNAGLMSHQEAHDKINVVSAVLMVKELHGLDIDTSSMSEAIRG